MRMVDKNFKNLSKLGIPKLGMSNFEIYQIKEKIERR